MVEKVAELLGVPVRRRAANDRVIAALKAEVDQVQALTDSQELELAAILQAKREGERH